MKKSRRLPPEAVKALQDALVAAMARCREEVTEDRGRLGDIYAGRDKGGTLYFTAPPAGGVPIEQWVNEAKSGVYRSGAATVNLLTSRLIQIWVASAPGRPEFLVEPRTPGALASAETQETISAVALSNSGLERAVRDVAWLDPIQNYAGIKMVRNPRSRDDTDKITWQVIPAEDCGEEPFSCRFSWHARVEQWGSLDKETREAIKKAMPKEATEPDAWSPIAITEVYDESFALETGDADRTECRVHLFFNAGGKFFKDRRNKRPDVGTYAVTHDIPVSVLVIEANMPKGPDDAVAPVEAVNWLGPLDALSDCGEKIWREVSNTNRTVLYDSDRIEPDMIQKMVNAPTSNIVYLPVRGAGNDARGISHTMRPVERDSLLSELIASYHTFLAMLDDATGVGPQDRGVSVNPSKSATEASVLSASSSRRTAARLYTQIRRWTRCIRILFEYQREIYGEYLEVPIDGVMRKYRVPDPATTRYAFEISLAEMENLSRRARLDTQMMAHQLIVNHAVAFPNGEPMLAAESLRRTLKSFGWVDADAYTTERRQLGSPEDRYTKMLETGKDYIMDPNDDPIPHIAFLGQKLAEAQATGNDRIPVDRLLPTIQKFQILLRQREAQAASTGGGRSGVVPGMSAQGAVDNRIAAQTELGMPPPMSQQMLR